MRHRSTDNGSDPNLDKLNRQKIIINDYINPPVGILLLFLFGIVWVFGVIFKAINWIWIPWWLVIIWPVFGYALVYIIVILLSIFLKHRI